MSEIGADWYKRDPRRFLGGVRGLPAKELCVYTIVLDLIYDGGGRCPNDPKWISGWIEDMGPAAVRKAISSLVDRGKLRLSGDDLTNDLAVKLAKTRAETKENRRKSGEKGGKKSADLRRKSSDSTGRSNDNNDIGQASASTPVQPDKIREDKNPPNPPEGGTGDAEVLTLFPDPPPVRDRFEDFWSAWRSSPHKNRKADARKKFERLLLNHSADVLIDGAERYMASREGQDPKYDVNPANWLAQERWQEAPQPSGPAGFVPSFPLEVPVPPRNPLDPQPHDMAVQINRINKQAWMKKQKMAGRSA